MNLRKDHYRGLVARARAVPGVRPRRRRRRSAEPVPRAERERGPRGGPRARRGLPCSATVAASGHRAPREGAPRGAPGGRAAGPRRWGALPRAGAAFPSAPLEGRGGVLPARAWRARFRRRGRRRSAAGPPPRSGGRTARASPPRPAAWNAGRGFPRPSPSSPEPGSCASRVRAGGRGCRHGPSRRRSPLARRPAAGLRRRRLRRFSWTRACALPGRRGPPRPRRHPASRLRWRPALAGVLLRGPTPVPPPPPHPAAVCRRRGEGGWDGGPRERRGRPRSERGRQRAGRVGAGGAGLWCEPRRPSPLGREEEAASGGDGAAAGASGERGGSSGSGEAAPPTLPAPGWAAAEQPARPAGHAGRKAAGRSGLGARRRAVRRRGRHPPRISPPPGRERGGWCPSVAVAGFGGRGSAGSRPAPAGRPEPRLSSRAQRRATEGNPGPRAGGRGDGGGCRARPRGWTLRRGRQRGRHPRGACRSFPSPQGQVPSVRASAALPRRARGPKAAEPGGGLKTRAARCEPGGGPGRRCLTGRELLPQSPWVAAACARPAGSRAGEGSPCPPLSAVRSRRRDRGAVGRGRPACLETGDPGRERGLSAGAASPRGGGGSPGGRRAAAPLSQRCAALRSAPLPPLPAPASARRSPAARPPARAAPRPSGGGAARRVSVGRRAAAAGRGCPGPGPARRFPVALRGRAGQAVGRPRASPARSPRGNGESGRRPRLSAARLPPGACSRKGPRREAAAVVPGGQLPPARRRAPSGGPRAVRCRLGLRRSPPPARWRSRGGAGGVRPLGGAGCGSCGAGGAEARAGPAGRPAAALRRQPCPERGGQAARSGARRCLRVWRPGRARAPGPPPKRARCISAGRSGARAPPALAVRSFSSFLPPTPPLLRVCSYGEARRGLSVAPRRYRPPRPRAGGGAGEPAGGGPSSEKGPLLASGPGPPARAGRCRKADNS